MILHAVVEEFFIEDEIQYLSMQNHRLVTISCVLETLRQAHVPRITGFAENVLPAFTSENFRCHFRISIQMFEEILHILRPTLLPKHGGGTITLIL